MTASHQATFYAHVQAVYPYYAKDRVSGIKVTRITQNKPDRLDANTVAVKLTIELPDDAFAPFSPSATITVPASQVQKAMHVILEQP